ncbi:MULTISPECIES: hypothetical protein [unclassified Acinetobacter]|uniref:hypothetical protein n=1 Tax=unclassified Acinetobacter TaxID=196816 RepID=UPI000DA65785|nr:hypothetical protein [Acinetobacter sp. WCHAc060042]
MEFINPIAALIALIIAIFSIPKTLHAINEHKRKKFKDELDFYKEYLDNYYQKTESELSLLLKDKAAQTLTRSTVISAKLADYFILLHEQKKLNFQDVTDAFHFGHKYIHVDEERLVFSPKINQIKFRKNLYYLIILALLAYIYVLYGTNAGESFHIVVRSLGTIFSIILCIQFLDKILNLEESAKFFEIVDKAQAQVKSTTQNDVLIGDN